MGLCLASVVPCKYRLIAGYFRGPGANIRYCRG